MTSISRVAFYCTGISYYQAIVHCHSEKERKKITNTQHNVNQIKRMKHVILWMWLWILMVWTLDDESSKKCVTSFCLTLHTPNTVTQTFFFTSRQTCEIMLLLFYYQVAMILVRLTLQADAGFNWAARKFLREYVERVCYWQLNMEYAQYSSSNEVAHLFYTRQQLYNSVCFSRMTGFRCEMFRWRNEPDFCDINFNFFFIDPMLMPVNVMPMS